MRMLSSTGAVGVQLSDGRSATIDENGEFAIVDSDPDVGRESTPSD